MDALSLQRAPAWAMHGISIFFGLLTTSALTGTLLDRDSWQENGRLTSYTNFLIRLQIQFAAFLAGMFLLAAFGVLYARKAAPAASPQLQNNQVVPNPQPATSPVP